MTPEEWTATLDVNLTGVYRCCAAVLPGMVARGRGSVVVIGSVTGARPLLGRTPYAASKLALVGLVRTAALDCADAGVRINLVAPGPIDGDRLRRVVAASGRTLDEMFGEHRPVTEREVADAVASLLAEDSDVTGADVEVSGGRA